MRNNFTEDVEDIFSMFRRQKKALLITIGSIFLLFIFALIFMPRVQTNIRAAEVKSMVNQDSLNKKALYMDIKTADQEISGKTAVTVLFSEPSGEAYEKLLSVLKNSTKMSAFNHTIYIYPIVYNASEIEKKYSVSKTEATIIFFEDGKEKNRLAIDKSFEVQSMLIPALNQLPLATN